MKKKHRDHLLTHAFLYPDKAFLINTTTLEVMSKEKLDKEEDIEISNWENIPSIPDEEWQALFLEYIKEIEKEYKGSIKRTVQVLEENEERGWEDLKSLYAEERAKKWVARFE